ncbi:B12-binding domain-containing protein [Desulfosporosinus sp. FKB]|uniref:B12-binding domain-containing protein n=1 Tax=Desulfosporosinus sp. FKB TaxID=1969835 RepID=UPI001FA822B7|nr:B12-binding domain-containing protein [Desulfosporosinus sp. FKB]
MSDFAQLAQTVFKGNADAVKEMPHNLVDQGVNPMDIISQGLLAGMDIVSPKFKAGEMFVPESLAMVIEEHRTIKKVGRSLSYLYGHRLNI